MNIFAYDVQYQGRTIIFRMLYVITINNTPDLKGVIFPRPRICRRTVQRIA